MTPTPFRISVPQSKVDLLKTKLSQAVFPDELQSSQWDYGVPLADMKRLTKAWQQWDWSQAEEKLNKAPQFMQSIKVDGFDQLDIHFVWQKSEVKNAIPLLFVHGVWPGSFLEVLPLLPLLRAAGGPAFHVIAPSLPNYGFSSSVQTRGFAAKQYAETCHKLMLSLGYPKYVTQGGDWGFYITRAIGHFYPQSCMASHLNMLRCNPPTMKSHPFLTLKHKLSSYTQKELEGFKRTEWFAKEGRGYFMEQSTKPQTLAYSLNDSPVGLLAWIYEKLHDWTDEYPWSDDEILTWVSVYAFSRAGPGASLRIYYEFIHTVDTENTVTRETLEKYIPNVKLGLAHNPKELSVLPDIWARTMGDVVYETFNDSGGHFYATEHPELLARDLRTMFGKGGGAYKVVEGKSGYDNSMKSRL